MVVRLPYMGSVYCKYIATKQSRKGRKRPSYNGNIFVVTFIVQLLILADQIVCHPSCLPTWIQRTTLSDSFSRFVLLANGKYDMENIYDGSL
jgi:hypothetical protein